LKGKRVRQEDFYFTAPFLPNYGANKLPDPIFYPDHFFNGYPSPEEIKLKTLLDSMYKDFEMIGKFYPSLKLLQL